MAGDTYNGDQANRTKRITRRLDHSKGIPNDRENREKALKLARRADESDPRASRFPIEPFIRRIEELFLSCEDPIFVQGRRMFRRGGPLQPRFLVSLLLYMIRFGPRRGYARMLEAFWDESRAFGLELPRDEPVSAQAFSAARQKLPAKLVRGLLNAAAEEFDDAHGERFRWHGRRLLAVDGQRRFVQPSDELRRELGGPGSHYPQCHVSVLYDVCARLPIDAAVGPYGTCERRQLVVELFDRTREGDVLVVDSGYPGFDVFAILAEGGRDFIARVPTRGTFKQVEDFVASGERDADLVLPPTRNSLLRGMEPLQLRVVRVDEPGGAPEPWILLTTLPRAEISVDDLADAYHRRWEVETFHGQLVSEHFGQGYFHARTRRGVEQEIFAQMLFAAISRHLTACASDAAGVNDEEVPAKAAVLACGDHLTRLVLRWPPEQARANLTRLLKRIASARERPRKPRKQQSYPRRSLRPKRRWGARGRTAGG